MDYTGPNVKVNLKEYPKFWERLRIKVTARSQAGLPMSQNMREILDKEFNLTVSINSYDILGNVVMDNATYTWFTIQWS